MDVLLTRIFSDFLNNIENVIVLTFFGTSIITNFIGVVQRRLLIVYWAKPFRTMCIEEKIGIRAIVWGLLINFVLGFTLHIIIGDTYIVIGEIMIGTIFSIILAPFLYKYLSKCINKL